MRLEFPLESRAFWYHGLRIDHEIGVVELDAGNASGLYRPDPRDYYSDEDGDPEDKQEQVATYAVSKDKLEAELERLAIIIPCKNEDLEALKIVLGGIPHGCQIILVSNSSRGPDRDRYRDEIKCLRDHCFKAGGRQALAIHQKDPWAAEALKAAGMTARLFSSDGRIRNGKGEGMLLGVAVTAIFCKDRSYLGFVDADCTIPGAVSEYCRAYAAGFGMCHNEKNLMVRIHWGSKPKVVKGAIDYKVEGRSTVNVNQAMNDFLRLLDPDGEWTRGNGKIMTTGNAGEHAMTVSLACQLVFAGEYAVEPQQVMDLVTRALVDVWQTTANSVGHYYNGASGVNGHGNGAKGYAYGGHSHHRNAHGLPPTLDARILQIRTQNPHFHRATDDRHIRDMWLSGVGTIYHNQPLQGHHVHSSNGANGHPSASNVDVARAREQVLELIAARDSQATGAPPPEPRVYTPLVKLDTARLEWMMQKAELVRIGHNGNRAHRDPAGHGFM